ncbi:alpha/beta hydrolase [Streptomyces sp. NPDC023588]|uniref:alpha/beta hydrolase n=1 Tax=Streptomyces sp. NPDC023588 TaxID=3154907 RepID=UPI0033FDC839
MHRSRASAALAACALIVASLAAAPATGGDPLARFHGQRIRWGACAVGPGESVPRGMRCGTVEVPLDYAAPAKGTITLALARIAANDRARRIGSLLLNFGGPGSPGVAALAADPKAFAALGERYDLVAFDPRGVGSSGPISCGGSQQTAQEPGGEDAAAQLAALRAVARRCELASGPVLPYVGTVNVSRDMDVMRRILGDRKLNYLGFSYGTRLGAVYAAQFPRDTGRMVLDGVDTLTEPLAEQALVSARGQQRALERFLAWCTHQKGCVYGTNLRSAKEEIGALVARLDREPLVGHDGSFVTGQDAVASISLALYAKSMWPALAEALAMAERDGDPVGLMQLGGPAAPSDSRSRREGAGRAAGTVPVPADNGEAALVAVNCADDPDRSNDRATPAAVEKELAALEGDFLQASKIFGPSQLRTVLACYGRPAGTDFIRKIDHPGAPRMLLIGTRGDPATPYEWTEETAKRLGSAVVVDYKGDGHTGYAASPCVREYADRFLIDGRLPSGTRSCPAGE